jgi:hypothetical protein
MRDTNPRTHCSQISGFLSIKGFLVINIVCSWQDKIEAVRRYVNVCQASPFLTLHTYNSLRRFKLARVTDLVSTMGSFTSPIDDLVSTMGSFTSPIDDVGYFDASLR